MEDFWLESNYLKLTNLCRGLFSLRGYKVELYYRIYSALRPRKTLAYTGKPDWSDFQTLYMPQYCHTQCLISCSATAIFCLSVFACLFCEQNLFFEDNLVEEDFVICRLVCWFPHPFLQRVANISMRLDWWLGVWEFGHLHVLCVHFPQVRFQALQNNGKKIWLDATCFFHWSRISLLGI